MQFIVVSADEWLYPDRTQYQSAADRAKLHAARSSYACLQVLVTGVKERSCPIRVDVTGGIASFIPERYELVAIPVASNYGINEKNARPMAPNRIAPFDVYDCVKPLEDSVSAKDGAVALYFSFPIPKDAKPGIYEGALSLTLCGEELSVPVWLKVYKAVVPKETLKQLNTYHYNLAANYSHTKLFTPEYYGVEQKHFALLRRMRQNVVTFFPQIGVKKVSASPTKYEFDFSMLEGLCERGLKAGMTFIGNRQCIARRKSWKESTMLINGEIPAMSYEGYVYLSQYLPALTAFLKKKGWTDIYYQSIADEPNDANATEYRALCGLVRKLAPEIKLMDALSHTHIYGALDVWIPLNASYDKYMDHFETFRGKGDELWDYTCCGPRGDGYINRFMDYPLLSTRYLFWGNYTYNLTGFLHWGWATFQPGQDPFTNSDPFHTNTDSNGRLPPGDTHIVYPLGKEVYMSMRLEASRRSAEDYELLCLLAKTDKKKADEICGSCFKNFKEVDYDVCATENAYIALLDALS